MSDSGFEPVAGREYGVTARLRWLRVIVIIVSRSGIDCTTACERREYVGPEVGVGSVLERRRGAGPGVVDREPDVLGDAALLDGAQVRPR